MHSMPDFSKGFQIDHDDATDSCAIRFRCFDTPNSITVYGYDAPDDEVQDLLIGLQRTCLDYHRLWSFSLPESDISRINRPVTSIAVDARTVGLISAMKRFCEREPAFDFTIGSVSYLWKHARSVPSDAALAEALRHVGADQVEVGDGMVVKADPAAKVDVGGAAKGYVADELADVLRDAGVHSADIDLGGNLYLVGRHPAGRPWRVSVRIPEGVRADPVVLEVEGRSVVTSGTYERFSEIDGVRYAHVIDAGTGRPAATDFVSVTVVSDSSLAADLLATTALIGGSAGLPALADRHPDCAFVPLPSTGVGQLRA